MHLPGCSGRIGENPLNRFQAPPRPPLVSYSTAGSPEPRSRLGEHGARRPAPQRSSKAADGPSFQTWREGGGR
jgi:hypothetical protein